MRTLLINPPDMPAPGAGRAGVFPYLSVVRRGRVLPPLGLCSLAAVLREAGVPVAILDADALNLSIDRVANEIRRRRPGVVGVTTAAITLNTAYRVCRAAKRIDPAILTILGGAQAITMPAETADHPAVDVIVAGEGEPVIRELIEAGRDRDAWSAIPGLAYREDGRIVQTGPAVAVEDVNRLPLPARDLLPLDRYYDVTALRHRVMSTMTTRGCPFRCLFCDHKVAGGPFRPYHPERVVDEMEMILRDLGVKEIEVYDDTFAANREHAVAICEEILRRGLTFTWECRTRVDCVTPDLLRLMKRAGCHRIGYGVESASPRVLRILRKGITPEQARQAIRWTREAGLRSLAFFMLGSPGDTRRTIEETIRFSLELDADFAVYTITVAWPGTAMWRMLVRLGLADAGYWRDYVRNEGVLTGPVPTFAATPAARRFIERANRRAYLRYYFRPSYVWRHLKGIRSGRDLAWQARLATAMLRLQAV